MLKSIMGNDFNSLFDGVRAINLISIDVEMENGDGYTFPIGMVRSDESLKFDKRGNYLKNGNN